MAASTSGQVSRASLELTAASYRLRVAAGAVVCAEALLVGDVSIGAGTVVHPKAQLLAEAGPIVVGENNLIEENVVIANRHACEPGAKPTTVLIGDNNVFEIGCKIESRRVGNFNTVEIKAVVGAETDLGDGCVVGAACELTASETLADNSVVHGDVCLRRVTASKAQERTGQLEYLRKALPSYHYLATKKT